MMSKFKLRNSRSNQDRMEFYLYNDMVWMGQRRALLPKWCPNLELRNSGASQDRNGFLSTHGMVWLGQRGSLLPKWHPNLELRNSGTNQDRTEFLLHMVWSEWVREEVFYQNDIQI